MTVGGLVNEVITTIDDHQIEIEKVDGAPMVNQVEEEKHQHVVKAVAEELEIKPALINKAIKIAHKGEWHKYSDDFDSLENLIIAVGRDK